MLKMIVSKKLQLITRYIQWRNHGVLDVQSSSHGFFLIYVLTD